MTEMSQHNQREIADITIIQQSLLPSTSNREIQWKEKVRQKQQEQQQPWCFPAGLDGELEGGQ